MDTNGRLDCIIVGYNDRDFRARLSAVKAAEKVSAAYDSLRIQSLPLNGQRVTYMELLSQVVRRATGHDPALHIGQIPSLGSWYLWNFVTKSGYSARTINCFNLEREEFARLLVTTTPRAVAVTTTYYVDDAPIREVADFVRKHSPTTKVVVGGPHAFNVLDAAESDAKLDAVLKAMGGDIFVYDSQGELTLSRVLGHLRGEKRARDSIGRPAPDSGGRKSLDVHGQRQALSVESMHEIPNIVFFEGSTLVRTRREIEDNDIDASAIDWDAIDPANFVPTVSTRTARSCAFACSFCRYPIMAGPLNLMSIDAVIRQFDQFQRHGVRQVIIVDDTFNVPLPRFKDLCRAVKARRYDFTWYSYLRASNADDEAFDLAAESGCRGVFLGIESGDQSILDGMNKAAKRARYMRGIQELNKRGIITFASMILGFPGESRETVDNTIAFLNEAKPSYWRPGLYFHSNTAPIQTRAEELGIRGTAYSWTHLTMNWREAVQERRRMLREVTESTHLPGYNFDFWAIPYLIGNGVTVAQHKRFCGMAQELLLRELDGSLTDVAPRLDALADAFRGADGAQPLRATVEATGFSAV